MYYSLAWIRPRLAKFEDDLRNMGLSANQLKSKCINVVTDRTREVTALDTTPVKPLESEIPPLQPNEEPQVLGILRTYLMPRHIHSLGLAIIRR